MGGDGESPGATPTRSLRERRQTINYHELSLVRESEASASFLQASIHYEQSLRSKMTSSHSNDKKRERTNLRMSLRLQKKDDDDEYAFHESSPSEDNSCTSDDDDESSTSGDDDDAEYTGTTSANRKRRRSQMETDGDDFDSAALTPRVLKHLSAKKRMSTPAAAAGGRNLELELIGPEPNEMSENVLEGYFTAFSRISTKKLEETKNRVVAMNDSRRGKKPRKGTRGLGGAAKASNVPTLAGIDPSFSVTQECSRVAANSIGGSYLSDAIDRKHAVQTEEILRNSIQNEFDRWMLMMKEGFSIVLYGFGSKRNVFRSFKTYLEEDWLIVTINGMYPKLHPKKFLTDFCEALDVDEKIKIRGLNSEILAEEVLQTLSCVRHPDVFLFVKNIDNLAISHPGILTVVCALAQVKWIHVVASTDSVNASLGITQSHAVALNMCWVPCPTFKSFEEELSWNPSAFGEKSSSEGGKNTLQYVLKSLTGNARKAFSILASLQLAKFQEFRTAKSRKNECGVEFRELARKCRENFLAHSDGALNTLLREFIDHKLITQQGKKSAGSLLSIDLDTETLQEIVSNAL